jgi:hypothetical protein
LPRSKYKPVSKEISAKNLGDKEALSQVFKNKKQINSAKSNRQGSLAWTKIQTSIKGDIGKKFGR